MDHKNEIHAIRMGRLLLRKKMQGNLTDSEQAALDQWCQSSPHYQRLYDEQFDPTAPHPELQTILRYDATKALDRLHKKRTHQQPVRRISKAVIRWSAAAILLITSSVGIYLYNRHTLPQQKDTMALEADVSAGNDQAVLTLADGTIVDLSEEQAGIVIGEKGISYVNGSAIGDSHLKNQKEQILSLRTPRGGQYQIQLSDGTKVWLNAGSELKYPLQFTGDIRQVELSGEAYFEVAHQYKNTKAGAQRIPFTVLSDRQIIQVLGTSFNVSAYVGSPTKTTLLEGSVSISASNNQRKYLLKPLQQLTIDGDDVTLKNIESNNSTLWKDGVFNLSGVALQELMEQVSRWYNVDVSYRSPELRQLNFEGTVPRYETLKSLLAIIEKAGDVSFELKDNTVIVKKKPNKPTAYGIKQK